MWYKIKRMLIRIVYSYILRNNIRCAKLLGVHVGERDHILDDPGAVFGSEPWLVRIGDHVEITNGVRFITHEGALWCLRELYTEMRDYDLFRPITVGNNVMIGNQSIIMPGVTIGSNVIIGANSVVTRNIPDNTVVAGSPARQISTMEDFLNKVKNSPDLFESKHMSQAQKLSLLKQKRPEWFV